MNQNIRYNGYSAVPSDYECNDGELAASLNVISEDGQLQPIPRPKVVIPASSSTNQKVLYVHETTAYKHYIVLDSSDNKIKWKSGSAGTGTELGSFWQVTHCNAIGNTLMVFTENEIHYFLWQNNAYVDLGTQLPNIQLSFGLVGHPRLFSKTDSSGSTFTINFNGIAAGDIRNEFTDENKTKITEQIMGKLNRFIREQTVEKGRFCFPFFVRYALRMYDGSLVCHSNPILMNPSTLPAPIVLWNRATGKSSYTDATCDIFMVAASLDYYVLRTNDVYNIDKWKDLITGIEVFISKPLYTYDQEGKISSLTDTNNFDSKFIGRLYHNGYHRGGSPAWATSVTEDKILSPIAIGGSESFLDHYMEWKYSQIYALYFSTTRTYPGESFHLPEFSSEKNGENVRNCSLFYKLCTITLDEAKSMTARKDIPIEDEYLQSLVTREVMTDDYLSHDQLCADSSQVYNSRLNLSGVKRKPFNGFSPNAMFSHCDRNIPSFSVDTSTHKVTIELNPYRDMNLMVSVYLKEGGKVHLLQTSGDTANYLSDWRYTDASTHAGAQRVKKSWGNYFFYPNVNAVKIAVNGMWIDDSHNATTYGGTYVVDLKPHEFLNGAYAFIDYDTIRKHNYVASDMPGPIASPYDLIDCGSKIYTSEVNNPFFFPVTGINTVGTGKILGMATAAKALSEGQFGQFPLYAFTTEGVWAMEVSATGTYSAKQPITRDVCINPDSITQIDSAVLFATDRGIMLISGSQTQCISEVINSESPFDVLSLKGMEKLHAMLGHDADTCFPTAPFSQFLSACGMIYDYVHQHIIVYNPNYTYAYVYSLKSKMWGMMASTLCGHVNSYPEALAVQSDGALVDFAQEPAEASSLKALAVTRPIKLGAADIHKTIDTIIQRGHFRKGAVQSVLYGSRDIFNWHLIWSSKDHFLRSFHGTGYKYFRIALLCDLQQDESIFGASVQFNLRLNNQPR